jgi:serine/threonine-protein kinase SRPK3
LVEEDGQPMSEQDQDRAGVLHRTSMKLLEIGKQGEEEVDLLADLLQKMLKYRVQEEISIWHLWFTL